MYVVCSMCMYVVICQIDRCIHIHWCIVMGLGHNDPWVESHMWPQQTLGQRSCRGQWPLVLVFGKKDQCIHILWCFFKSNITWCIFKSNINIYDCKSMCSWKQARPVVREPPCLYDGVSRSPVLTHDTWDCVSKVYFSFLSFFFFNLKSSHKVDCILV